MRALQKRIQRPIQILPTRVKSSLCRFVGGVAVKVDLVAAGRHERRREHLADGRQEVGREVDGGGRGEAELAGGGFCGGGKVRVGLVGCVSGRRVEMYRWRSSPRV